MQRRPLSQCTNPGDLNRRGSQRANTARKQRDSPQNYPTHPTRKGQLSRPIWSSIGSNSIPPLYSVAPTKGIHSSRGGSSKVLPNSLDGQHLFTYRPVVLQCQRYRVYFYSFSSLQLLNVHSPLLRFYGTLFLIELEFSKQFMVEYRQIHFDQMLCVVYA